MCTQHPPSCRYSDSICRSICFYVNNYFTRPLSYKTTQYLQHSGKQGVPQSYSRPSTYNAHGTAISLIACTPHSVRSTHCGHEVYMLHYTGSSTYNVHGTAISRITLTPQSVRSTPSYKKDAYHLCYYLCLTVHT